MWELTGGAENRPIPVTKICEFGRMKRFQPRSAVVTALKASNFLEVSGAEGDEQIKRKNPFDPTIPKSKVEARSVYVKGFGDEEPSSQFDIEAFFAPYGPTNAVRLRRTDDKLFKGSVFVEFQDEEIAKKFLEMDPKPVWKGCHPLEIKSKTQYIETKAQEIRDGKVDPKAHRGNRGGRGGNHRGSNRGRGDNRDRTDRNRGDRDPDDWKKRREDDRASGFKDDRKNGRNDRRGNNRGGRGRRDDRGPRNNDRNRERDEKNK
jgi:lupus La protein